MEAVASKAPVQSKEVIDRIGGALWGLFIGDALAMPTHWFYGGSRQVESMYGGLLTGYTKPIKDLPGSIMNLSNTGGGGRGSDGGDIIGKVINHGKKQYWTRNGQYFYHCTLAKAENTLEAQLVRLVCQSICDGKGSFKADDLRNKYMKFMQTPGSHNDCYASTCHRMFFANAVRGIAPEQCPDNDGHNVDTIDGLIMPVPVVLATVDLPQEDAVKLMNECAGVTRSSKALPAYQDHYGSILRAVVKGTPLREALETYGGRDMQSVVRNAAKREDPVVACYISSNYPSLIHFASKYENDFEGGLLANANCGGENVHRGCVLGALLGAHVGESGIPAHLKNGLHDSASLSEQIEAFKSCFAGTTSAM